MKESRSAKKPAASRKEAPAVAPDSDLDLPEDGGIRLTLPGFEGPLDLMLHLIQEHELDILNIPIAFVTNKYLEYIGMMQELNIDIASEYLVMAATLAHIKSRMLLPTPPADLEDGEEEELDPRAELIRRLLEYQKYKKAGEELAARSVLGRDVFVRGAQPTVDPTTAPLAPVNSFKLLEAFQRILTRAKIVVDHQIEFERFSLSDRINQLVDMLKDRGRVTFEDLFEGQRNRADLIVTFLALLELTRLRMTRLFQDGSLEPIFVELSVSDEDDPNAYHDGDEPDNMSKAAKPTARTRESASVRQLDPRDAAPEANAESDSEDEDDENLDDLDLAALGLDVSELDDEELDANVGQAVATEGTVATELADEPRKNVSRADESGVDEHAVTENEVAELDEPREDESREDEPSADEPSADEPREDEPRADEPRADEPLVDAATAKELAELDEPREDEPREDEPREDEPRSDNDTDVVASELQEPDLHRATGTTDPVAEQADDASRLPAFERQNPTNDLVTDPNASLLSTNNEPGESDAVDVPGDDAELVLK